MVVGVVVVVGCWESDVNINAGRSRFVTVVCALSPTHLSEIIRNEIPLVRTGLGSTSTYFIKRKKLDQMAISPKVRPVRA